MMNKVVVIGSYNVDVTLCTETLPKVGETIIGKSLKYGHGGKGANQAVAACRSGASVTFLARFGEDQYGADAVQFLETEGITILQPHGHSSEPTGMAFITVNAEGENSIVVISGANGELSASDIRSSADTISASDVLLTQLETPIPAVAAAISTAHKHGVTVILDPAPVQELSLDLLKQVDIITPNLIEVEMLTGIKIINDAALPKAAQVLHQVGIETVLITLGGKGVYVSSPGLQKLIPTIDVEVIDTVGAGDVFSGVLAANYSGLATLEETIASAIVASGLSVTRMGAQTAIPRKADISAYMESMVSLESS